MHRDGVSLVVQHVKKFMALKDYAQMRQRSKGDLGFSEIGKTLAQKNQTQEIPAQDNQVVTAAMVPEIKKAYKDFYVKVLQGLLKQYPYAAKQIATGIQEIQALK